MSTLQQTVDRLSGIGFINPQADPAAVVVAQQRGVPEPLLELYRIANGMFLVEGDDFRAPNGKRYRFMIPPLENLQSVAQFGFADDDSPLFPRLENWWQFFDYGDSNWVGITDAEDGLRIVDLFPETVGEPGSHTVIADSIEEFLWQINSGKPYWLDAAFEGRGSI